MVLKSAFAAALCTGLLMSGGPALADEYRAGEFLGMDLSRAVLSPKRLGPETQFAPVPDRGENRSQAGENGTRGCAKGSGAEAAKRRKIARRESRTCEKPRGAARAKLARRHSNPLDAQARDTRIQTWPCKSGGICGWQNQPSPD